jgi:glycosyltransferase involved in cell wall biosynthesis
VGFIGTFGHWHGIDFLAERIVELATEEAEWLKRKKLHFMLVGDGLKMAAVRRILDTESVRNLVTLTGLVPQSDAAKYLAAADLLVSPHVPNPDGSEFFGSPTKLFEYMAMKRPIVASALGQIGDVVAGRGATKVGDLPAGAGLPCGLVFEPGNARAFNAALRRLVDDPELAGSLAKAARAEVLARYTWPRHVNAILERMIASKLLLPDALTSPLQ